MIKILLLIITTLMYTVQAPGAAPFPVWPQVYALAQKSRCHPSASIPFTVLFKHSTLRYRLLFFTMGLLVLITRGSTFIASPALRGFVPGSTEVGRDIVDLNTVSGNCHFLLINYFKRGRGGWKVQCARVGSEWLGCTGASQGSFQPTLLIHLDECSCAQQAGFVYSTKRAWKEQSHT